MKIVNKPIKVMAIFFSDGKIEPVKFWLDDQAVIVEKIIKSYVDKNFGNNNLMFVCQHNGSDIYELKYDVKNNTWYLFKK